MYAEEKSQKDQDVTASKPSKPLLTYYIIAMRFKQYLCGTDGGAGRGGCGKYILVFRPNLINN